jgi:hypothetical protein
LKKIILPLLLLSTVPYFAGAQAVRQPVTAIYTRLSSYSSAAGDAFSFTANPAALAAANSFSAGLFSERRFLLQALSLYSAAAVLPTPSGSFGLSANYFGGQAYNESAVKLAYGRSLGKVDAGIGFTYNGFKVSGYGHAAAINFEADAMLHVAEGLQTGIYVYNPLSSKIGKGGEEKLPAIYAAGFGYDASSRFYIGAEVQKAEDQPVNVAAGLQYRFTDGLLVRGGLSSATSTYYFGIGFLLNRFRIDVTASVHPQLGLTPGTMLLYAKPVEEEQ